MGQWTIYAKTAHRHCDPIFGCRIDTAGPRARARYSRDHHDSTSQAGFRTSDLRHGQDLYRRQETCWHRRQDEYAIDLENTKREEQLRAGHEHRNRPAQTGSGHGRRSRTGDAISGGKTAMAEDEMRAALQQLRTSVQASQEAKAHEEGASARKEGDAFLASNKSKDGVQTLPDGLQYKVLQQGSGPKPTASDTVTVNYRGTLINGKEFDSSYKRGQPISFPVNGVIKGWTEALQLMPVGSKWQLYIPTDLAYGDRGAGSDIGPGETLIFDVELISIGDQTQQKK
jgi:FKBP-type peptidyl-prolyl cis-trans isomerase FklB